MKLRPAIKFAIFWFLIYLLSCASGPKVKEIAALHYGDDEVEVVEKLGEGSETLIFKLDGTDYSYRYYRTTLTDHMYTLLFADGGLHVAYEGKQPIDDCISLIEWDDCFRSAISEMQSKQLSADHGDFSNALSEEEKIQKGRTGAAVIGTPLLVVAWPIVLGLGAMCAVQGELEDSTNISDDISHARQKSECTKALQKIEERIGQLYPDSSMSNVIDIIDKTSLDALSDFDGEFTEHIYDISEGNRHIYGKHWACGDYSIRQNLIIMYGGEENDLVWMSKNIQPSVRTLPSNIIPSAQADSLLQLYWDAPTHNEAKRWLCRSADSGYSEARYRLGLLYETGSQGVPDDPVKAYMWYRLAASTGDYMRSANQAKRLQEKFTTEQAILAETLIQEWEAGQCEIDLYGETTEVNE
jgi:hypothetical protein